MRRLYAILVLLTAAVALAAPGGLSAQSDLDAFMKKVFEGRDENWKKLQQYVLDEREAIDLRGPNGTTLWGERHEYTWFIKDGYFVRSPLKFNGVTIGDADRRKYEAEYLEQQQAREKRAQERAAAGAQGPSDPAAAAAQRSPADVDGFIRQTRQPQ